MSLPSHPLVAFARVRVAPGVPVPHARSPVEHRFRTALLLGSTRLAPTFRRSAHTLARVVALGGVLAASLLVPVRALADATVVVELKRPDGSAAEGTVQLNKGDNKYSCNTDKAGRCELRGVAGGMYTVNVEQQGKQAPKQKTVVIPPSGEVKLIVNAS